MLGCYNAEMSKCQIDNLLGHAKIDMYISQHFCWISNGNMVDLKVYFLQVWKQYKKKSLENLRETSLPTTECASNENEHGG